jgi:ABC-type uncharacterized transport system substrate-binding protein
MAKKKTAMYTIIAVAIGDPGNNWRFNDPNDANLKKVRPYISGLITWLADQTNPPTPDPQNPLKKYVIGKQYVVEYRECAKEDLAATFDINPDLIFCMSTTVLDAAKQFTTTIPVVGIMSNPESEDWSQNPNVCGVSARRPQHAGSAYAELKKQIGKKQIYYLSKAGYPPSDAAKLWLPKAAIEISIDSDEGPDDIVDKIHSTLPRGSSLLVLPVDQFFGAAKSIIAAAQTDQSASTYWMAPDYAGSVGAYGGYGVAQETCGHFMAERVASIWSSSDGATIPDPPFVEIPEQWNKSRINKSVAKALKIKLKKK